MGFGQANLFCSSQNMTLPRPRNNTENAYFVNKFGPSWINVIVNAILDGDLSYANWERRLRGYLNVDKTWSIVRADEKRSFYCVVSEQESTCGAQLQGLMESRNWSFADRESNYFSKLTDDDLDLLDWGSKVRFDCAPRRPQFFICVRDKSGGQYLTKCDDKKCGFFIRRRVDMTNYVC